VVFDADEHTGRFGGAKAYFGNVHDVAGVMIGYPGPDELVVGGRGFLRARITVRGRAGHTGSERTTGYPNAVTAAARLVGQLGEYATPGPPDPTIGLPPRVTVTAVQGGEGYSIIPDRCTVDVDVRLTPSFDEACAAALIDHATAEVEGEIAFLESWPAFCLAEDAPIRVALTRAAQCHLPAAPPTKVAGPSNIGNYLAKLGIDATAGFGVRYHGLHGTDERIDLSTIPIVQAVYHQAILMLLSAE
jgi:succinyl-diaminopimelate desuccinylase